jgi:hypothetical protein
MARTCEADNCNNPVFGTDRNTSLGYCISHQFKRTDRAKGRSLKVPCPVKKPIYKPSGEGILFETLIKIRLHVSFITGLPIKNISFYNCHHVLTKAAYPNFLLFDINIVFLSNAEHDAVHTKAKSDLIKLHEGWIKYFEYYETLKIKYNQTKKL